MILVSVIIPIYNVEQFLSRCLDSVINQTYKNLEIILVNDGSSDNSLEICEDYAKKDNRIKIVNKNNGGLSSARNAGLDICKGKYISFIDSDDWVSLDYIDILYENIVDNEADISIVDFITKTDSNNNSNIENKNQINCYLQPEILQKSLFYELPSIACAKLYKSELFKHNRFTDGIIFEDEDIMYKLFAASKKVVVSKYIAYFYFQREQSIMAVRRKKDNISLTSDSWMFIFRNKEKFLKNRINIGYQYYINISVFMASYYCQCFFYSLFDHRFIRQRKKIRKFIQEFLYKAENIDSLKYRIKYVIVKYFPFYFMFRRN
ncbi:glycosyltransferase family 2 protein [Francisella philomiragia]|uniref:glycosyltransferase family 2 protein n=1 Tax=Francisella philomiragia TaxID=28110 RepID=UPI001905DAC4|nr:glycosyltransferase family 2 protein [Francisella philomiragia]MBK2255832.1 glycosyltransferase family 2 protein [Francisella philomiragia]MBK2268490.1 glycosyltransferase family 2 protein [Francisella philomiragia]MBK2271035.1 glycosyltransferase family 2 protein [Francisella philomiragia]MBK2274815.1 glycosyltransferase family 2 protein [Francisella philomiragia]MBK2294409.1 glycosyltransferase family 2 protein [Francisella philomiragia]